MRRGWRRWLERRGQSHVSRDRAASDMGHPTSYGFELSKNC